MICNALGHLLASPARPGLARGDAALLAAAIEESLRLEPAARSWTGTRPRTPRSAARGSGGDPATVSIAGANRDPAVFTEPDRFGLSRPEAPRRPAFAHGPHLCPGAHVARLETRAAIATLQAARPAPGPGPRRGAARPDLPQGPAAARALG